MLKKTAFALLAALAVVTTGRADIFVPGTETVNENVYGSPGAITGVNRITGTTLGGYEYANDITSTSPTKGDIVNIIVVDKITGYNQAGGGSPSSTFSNTVTLVGAIQARIDSTSAGAIN